MGVSAKAVETWLYDERRQPPHLAVLLIEARLRIARLEAEPRLPNRGERAEAIRSMLGDGVSAAEIGRRLGLSRQRVAQLVQQMGLSAKAAKQERRARREADKQARERARLDELERKIAAGIDLIRQGKSARVAALAAGVSLSRLYERARQENVRSPFATRWSPDLPARRQQAVEIVRVGGTYLDASAATGLSPPTVTEACREAGVRSRLSRRRSHDPV